MPNKMFSVKNLNIYGTSEQINQYSSDSTEFDYIKNSLEKIIHNISKKCTSENNYKKYARINTSIFLVAYANEKCPDNPYILIYKSSNTKQMTDNINIDDLHLLKDQNDVDMIISSFTKTNINTNIHMIPPEMEQIADNLIEKYINTNNSSTSQNKTPVD